MPLLLILGTAALGTYIWYNFFPREASVLARAPAHHVTLHVGATSAVTCRRLIPPRPEWGEFARFYVGCKDAKTASNELWIYAWHSWESGRRFSKPARPINLEEAPEWNR